MIDNINEKDLLLLFLYTPGVTNGINEPIVGRTRLMAFRSEKELKADFLKNNDAQIFEFIPYLFGPYDKKVIQNLNFFIDANFILEQDTAIIVSGAEKIENRKYETEEIYDDLWEELEIVSQEAELYEKKYLLSEKGVRYSKEKIWDLLGEYQKSLMLKFKTQIVKIPLDDLLSYVYKSYPDYTENSTIRCGKRKSIKKWHVKYHFCLGVLIWC